MLALAQLKAAAGDFETAEASILAVWHQLSKSGRVPDPMFVPLLEALFVEQRLDLASRMLRDRFDPGCAIELLIPEQGRRGPSHLGRTFAGRNALHL